MLHLQHILAHQDTIVQTGLKMLKIVILLAELVVLIVQVLPHVHVLLENSKIQVLLLIVVHHAVPMLHLALVQQTMILVKQDMELLQVVLNALNLEIV